MYKMKTLPFLLIGLLLLPESLFNYPLLNFGKADAHPIHATSNTYNSTSTNLIHVPVIMEQTQQHSEHVIGEKNSLECDACMYLANGLNQTVLHNPKVISTVTTEIEKICQVLPSSVQQLCINAAEQTAPDLLNHLGDMIATEGCSDLGICHSKIHHT